MSLDKNTVTRIAKLARIAVSEEEKEEILQKLNGTLKFVAQLEEVDTANVPQMTSVAAMTLPQRKDVVTDGHIQELIVKNAPQSDYGCFVVPKVIE